jgi:hypothetical protein
LARFIVTALGRAGSSLAVILLVKDFLSAALGEPGGRLPQIATVLGVTGRSLDRAGLSFSVCTLCPLQLR